MKGNPLVSILCLVYNHEPYLRQCLDGFVMQKTNFGFEAIVHDDASTDNSAAILREYAEKYPDIIKPIYEVENQYRKGTLRAIMDNAVSESSKYIAICEGDDYWTDPLKLQKQVFFLENHPEYGLVHTSHKQYLQEKNIFVDGWAKETSLDSNLISNKICTATVCYRKNLYEEYKKDIGFQNWPMGDAPLWIYLMSNSESKFLDDVTAVYRVLDKSASHFKNCKKEINFYVGGFEMKCFFIERLNKQYLYKIIAPQLVKDLKRLSYIYDENINFNFSSFFLKYKIWNPKLYLSTFATKSKPLRDFLRKYHERSS